MPQSKAAEYELLSHMIPGIRISPFTPLRWEEFSRKQSDHSDAVDSEQYDFWLDGAKNIQYFESGRSALVSCLINENLSKNDEVMILTTTGGPYISSCVTEAIEGIAGWSRKLTPKTRAVLIIHEFGFPAPSSLIERLKEKGLIIVEDCAYAFGSRNNGSKVGCWGDYAIYSLTKYFPSPYGGILASKKEQQLEKFRGLLGVNDIKSIKRMLGTSWPMIKDWNARRCSNWSYFSEKLFHYNIEPYFTLKEGIVPGVFLFKLPDGLSGASIKKILVSAGIESTEYYGQNGFFFPVHQDLTEYEKEYVLFHFCKGIKPV